MKSKKEVLFTLWIFVTLNYLYCDLIGLMDSRMLNQYINGRAEGMVIDESFLLLGGILMEIPIAMVLLTKVLRKKANCWANIIAGSIKTLAMIATLFVGNVTLYYGFFAFIEIGTTLFIVGYAFQWFRQKSVESI
jgi:hypothetical protein